MYGAKYRPGRRSVNSLWQKFNCLSGLLLLLFSACVQADDAVFNVYTVDFGRPGYGDVASNWVAAKYLATYVSPKVNLYVAPVHHRKFSTLVPQFQTVGLPHTEPMSISVGNGDRSVKVYWDTAPISLARNTRNTCNLAFTVDKQDHVTLPRIAVALNGSNAVPTARDSRSYKALSHNLLTGRDSDPFDPFLAFSVPAQSGLAFVSPDITIKGLMKDPGNPGVLRPGIFFTSTFANKSIFVTSEKQPPPVPVPGNYHYLGYAYTDKDGLLEEYVDLIKVMAESQPDRTFAVYIPRELEFGEAYRDVQIKLSPYSEPKRALQQAVAPNFMVYTFPEKLSHDEVDQFIAQSNLPVVVSGTMSLSQAIQWGKPFLYDVKPHLDVFTREMAEHFAGKDSFTNILISYNGFNSDQFLARFIGTGNGPGLPADVVKIRAATAAARNRYLFGIEDLSAGTVNWELYEKNRAELTRRIIAYQRGELLSRPAHHLLDQLPTVCAESRKTLSEVNAVLGKKSRVKGRRVNKEQEIRKLLERLDNTLTR